MPHCRLWQHSLPQLFLEAGLLARSFFTSVGVDQLAVTPVTYFQLLLGIYVDVVLARHFWSLVFVHLFVEVELVFGIMMQHGV